MAFATFCITCSEKNPNIEGHIHKVDSYEQLLYLYEQTVLRKVNLKDIMEIK